MRRLLLGLALAMAAMAVSAIAPAAAFAHPLGNFTINVYAGLVVRPASMEVDYVVDMAEIPAFQERAVIDADGDGAIEAWELDSYREGACRRLAGGVSIIAAAETVPLAPEVSSLRLLPGQSGLQTLRLECTFVGELGTEARERTIEVRDRNFPRRIGWREITAVGDGTTLVASNVPEHTASDRLSSYPDDRLGSTPDVRSATVTFRDGGRAADPITPADPVTPERSGVIDRLAARLPTLVASERLTVFVALAALGIAFLLGGLHALAPGHGKALVAAYAVAERGASGRAGALGLTVAATHTVGVAALGAVLSVWRAFAPERLYPWFALAGGAAIVAVGLRLLRRAAARSRTGFAEHDHVFDHALEHPQDHGYGRAGHPERNSGSGEPGLRGVIGLGFAGGLVPSPSALVVLLGATAVGRAWLGGLLVAAYGIGMACALMATAMVFHRVRRWLDVRGSARAQRILRALQFVAAASVTLGGILLATRAAVTLA